MSNWSAGYVTDVPYTQGYYGELNPLAARILLLNAGYALPMMRSACELGFGQGLSVNLHAAGSCMQWHGTDFNPAQAGFARELADIAGSGAELRDEAFGDFCQRPDLPDFDFIGLHGVWSWISDDNRARVVDFVRRKLRPGGLLYLGYNTQPGWAAMVPLRDWMFEHTRVMSSPGSVTPDRLDAALAFADRLFATDPGFLKANPQVAQFLAKAQQEDRRYLAHEYFNRDWAPMPFSRLAAWLENAKVDYTCSAQPLEHIDELNLSPQQQTLLAEIPDLAFRETTRDFCTNQQFRCDYWVKGARRLSPLHRDEALRAERIVLAVPRDQVALSVPTARGGVAQLHPADYAPLLDLLGDHQARTLGEIEQALGVSLARLVEAVLILLGTGCLRAAQGAEQVERAQACTDRLNAHLIDLARASGDHLFLASPVTGGGIPLGRIEQLFLHARSVGRQRPEDWAEHVWQLLSAQGQQVLKDGQPVESEADSRAELARMAQLFEPKLLPMLRALRIA